MKTFAFLTTLTLTLLLVLRAVAQDPEAAAAAAARQDAEERYKRINAAVEDLITAQAAQQKKIAELAESIAALREELTRGASQNSTTREELRSLAEKMQEIEKNREADKKLILKAIDDIGKRRPPATTVSAPPAERAEKGYEHVVQAGDTLSSIVVAYRKEGIKVTTDMVLKANPKLDPNKLQLGQKIFIPQP